MRRAELAEVPGIAECALPAGLAEQLPESAPGAPWECRAQAVVWLARARPEARQALAPGLRAGAAPLAVVGGMVRYSDTPVGSYDEVFGNVAFRAGRSVRTSVAFIAVDSLPSVVGGRANWSIPKTTADFTGTPTTGMSAEGGGWALRATPRPLGPALPLATTSVLVQQWPDGRVRTARMRIRGRVRLAQVAVDVRADRSLSGWLCPGRHLGLVTEDITFTLTPAT